MDYITNRKTYHFSYPEFEELFRKFAGYSDEEFIRDIPNILHFACFVSYLKELPIEATVGDEGIIHQLVHLLTIPDEPLIDITEIREQFNNLLELK